MLVTIVLLVLAEVRCSLGWHARWRGQSWTWCRDCFKPLPKNWR